MRTVIYQQLADVEDRLWWHESRERLVRSMLSKLSLPQDGVAVDVGCGTGGSLSLLSEFASQVIGIDKSECAVKLARGKHPDADIRLGDANKLDTCLSASSCDLITLFNVVYHDWIDDDSQTLRDVWSAVKPGGCILLTDSAFRCLSRRHDRAVMGRRRYRLGEMIAMMERAGFESVEGTYFNLSSFPIAWALARWERVRGPEDEEALLGELTVPPRWINEGMKLLMDVERGLTRLLGRLPLGVSFACTGRKPSAVTVSAEASGVPIPAHASGLPSSSRESYEPASACR